MLAIYHNTLREGDILMPKTIYIREFPDDLHKEAKIQAAREETTLRELVIKALTEYLRRKAVK
jgi:predicted HicB family RNase H-like nuclease